jgi:hypothetical protein
MKRDGSRPTLLNCLILWAVIEGGTSMWRLAQIAFVLLTVPFVLGGHARAADPTVVTLSCDGTVTDTTTSVAIPTDIDHQPKPIEKMGVIVNLNEGTVSFSSYVAPISNADAATVNFNGQEIGPLAQIAKKAGKTFKIDGMLDRVTGHMAADIMTYETKQLSDPNSIIIKGHYDVLCKATNRVF